MNPITKFFKFIFNDIKEDVKTVGYIYRQTRDGKPILDPEKKKIAIEVLKKAPRDLLKTSWYWILAIIFTFAMGSLVGYEHCEIQCNNFIIEEYGGYKSALGNNINSTEIFPSIPILPSNDGYETGKQEYQAKSNPVNPIR